MRTVTNKEDLVVGREAWIDVPLVDATDFETPETAIAFDDAGMAVKLIPEGKSAEVAKTLVTGDWDAQNAARGLYRLRINAAEIQREGNLTVAVKCTATDQVHIKCLVRKPRTQGPLIGASTGGLTGGS